ncbi:SdpI family protein [Natronorubrum sp. DTA28]|uniref:SdpI family protein n=1 Tax=Natronorubrum sp. DTA28 TaxID=3447019 RepID=UPI003F874B26
MHTVHRFGIAAAIVVLSGAASLLAIPSLPDQVVSHWNAAGEPDGTMSKTAALVFLPALSAGLLGVFALLPRIDPNRANIEAFRPSYDWFVVLFTGFLFVIHVGIIAFNLGYQFDFVALIVASLAPLFYFVGIVLENAKQNWFVGIRTPWTLSSEAVWDRTHELGSKLFKLAALVMLGGLVFDAYAIYFLLVPLLVTAGVTIVYSYVLYERLEETPSTSRGH